MDDLALVGRQSLNSGEHLRESLARVMPGIEVGCHGDVCVVERRKAAGLSFGVEREIAADREQPGRDASLEAPAVLPAQPEKSLLDDIAGGIQIAEQPLHVTEQRPLILGQRLDYPLRCWPHAVPNEDNGAAPIFLDTT